MARVQQAGAIAVLLLAGCGGSPTPVPPPVPPVTIPEPLSYLVQSRGTNGDVTTPLHAGDPMVYRRFDFGHYQAEDSFIASDGSVITTWSYAPWGPFNVANGDGGEQYVAEGDTVRVAATLDGGTPGVTYFVGADCGGIGWLLFRTDATSIWTEVLARLSGSLDPNNCNPLTLGTALTRYTRQIVSFPVLGAIDTIVSEHYDNDTVAHSRAMERLFFGRGWGRLAWQAFETSPPTVDLSTRCPDFGWSAPPAAGWALTDCRIVVNVEPWDGVFQGSQEWHP